VTTTQYDAAGHVTAVQAPLGRTTTYQYDALNRQTVTIDSLSHNTTTVYDAAGQVSSTTDVRGTTSSYLYDTLGRQTRPRKPSAQESSAPRRKPMTPQAASRLRQMAWENTTTTLYDQVGRVTETVDANGHATDYAHDAKGQVTTTRMRSAR